nr:beta-lactamase [uncultured bacterium]
MKRVVFLGMMILVLSSCIRSKKVEQNHHYESEDLIIEKVSEHVYRHVSYLNTESFGKVLCNGMIVIDGKEAIVFDTPTTDAVSKELIHWIKDTLESEIVAIVPTHFHDDCLGGLAEFHRTNIPSYAANRTIELARLHEMTVPQNGVDDRLALKVGGKEVELAYFGEGHTRDNIVGYYPNENVLFGGCLIKELGANEGNLADANPSEWANTVKSVKKQYSDVRVVIPGHGKPGGKELLDYTITLFDQ